MKYTLARHLLYSLSQKDVRGLLRWSSRVDHVIWARRGFAKTWQRRAVRTASFLIGLAGFVWLMIATQGQREMSLWTLLGLMGLCASGTAWSIFDHRSQFRGVAIRRLERLRTKCAMECSMGRHHQRTLTLQDPSTLPFDSVARSADPIMVSSFTALLIVGCVGMPLLMHTNRSVIFALVMLPTIFAVLLVPKLFEAMVRRRVRTARARGRCPDCGYDLLPDKAHSASCERCPECGLRYPLFDMVEHLSQSADSTHSKSDAAT